MGLFFLVLQLFSCVDWLVFIFEESIWTWDCSIEFSITINCGDNEMMYRTHGDTFGEDYWRQVHQRRRHREQCGEWWIRCLLCLLGLQLLLWAANGVVSFSVQACEVVAVAVPETIEDVVAIVWAGKKYSCCCCTGWWSSYCCLGFWHCFIGWWRSRVLLYKDWFRVKVGDDG